MIAHLTSSIILLACGLSATGIGSGLSHQRQLQSKNLPSGETLQNEPLPFNLPVTTVFQVCLGNNLICTNVILQKQTRFF